MVFKSRKVVVWLISLGVVLMIYLLYGRLSEIPPIEINKAAGTIADSNLSWFGDQVGRIDDVGVADLRRPLFRHRDKNGAVDREFGFEKLLRAVGDEWEIEKPFMNIFRGGLKCRLTADKGSVKTETVAGRTHPRDATLTGNVVVHVFPEDSSSIKESTIYLDEVVFISEKSQFSTTGPVEFVNENAQMLGRGVELIYNEELDRLEFLRIIHLVSLHLKVPSKASLFSSGRTDTESATGVAGPAQMKRSGEPAAARRDKNYRCLFSRNVVIDAPDQMVFADEVSINDIFFASASDEKSAKADTGQADIPQTEDIPAAAKQPREEFIDIVVTCDDGITVIPVDSSGAYASFVGSDTGVDSKSPRNLDDVPGRTTFVAQRIDYSATTDDTIAIGLSELTFYPKDVIGAEPNERVVPMKVTAHKKVRFLPASKQVIFEGDCRCTMIREEPTSQQSYLWQSYTLSAPRLTVDLTKEEAVAADIEHLTADGGTVRLSSVKTAAEELIGGIELKCSRFDYDTGRQMCLAAGPGIVIVDNSKISEPQAKVGRFSFRKPCYAFLQDFETLEYFFQTNQVIANAGPKNTLSIDYFPVVRGGEGPHVMATAGKIEAFLHEATAGRTELSMLAATDGITYEDQNKQFEGSEMFYNASESIITAWGDESGPCLLNGAVVDGIEYDLKTDKIKARIVAPGTLQLDPLRNLPK